MIHMVMVIMNIYEYIFVRMCVFLCVCFSGTHPPVPKMVVCASLHPLQLLDNKTFVFGQMVCCIFPPPPLSLLTLVLSKHFSHHTRRH